MASKITCLNCKNRSVCFKELLTTELEFINSKKTQIVYSKGENISKQGAFASYIMYMIDGLVRNYLETTNRKKTNISIAKKGDFIGLSSIFAGNIYNHSVIALKEVKLCLIETEAIKKLIETNSKFAGSLVKKYAGAEKNLYEKIKSISYKNMNGRLADTLLYLSSENFIKHNIFSHLNRKDIADFACLSTESTVKLLNDYKKEGIIKFRDKDINIIDKNRLVQISLAG